MRGATQTPSQHTDTTKSIKSLTSFQVFVKCACAFCGYQNGGVERQHLAEREFDWPMGMDRSLRRMSRYAHLDGIVTFISSGKLVENVWLVTTPSLSKIM